MRGVGKDDEARRMIFRVGIDRACPVSCSAAESFECVLGWGLKRMLEEHPKIGHDSVQVKRSEATSKVVDEKPKDRSKAKRGGCEKGGESEDTESSVGKDGVKEYSGGTVDVVDSRSVVVVPGSRGTSRSSTNERNGSGWVRNKNSTQID
ncbi:hypothetical protein BO71DRAFT_216956 [Aspergillus ellipticus CBS 707.79]|uniref:Uncharacterized protein n=1 Tax=Aspergillus ellipticus CBS 707.79 TaxID=1448320 RepID=A0A319EUN5_9EURO|nr:hypothetical protein BO71DRAFT_216956 [Aspergillus ellipticus CBS 707.79]